MMMQTGGPYYQVELGRLDGKVATRAIVKHSLPGPSFNLNQLTKLFAANGLTQTDMIALSGIHILSLSLSLSIARHVHITACQTPLLLRYQLHVLPAAVSLLTADQQSPLLLLSTCS
jgi:hypothetical protein